MSSTSKRIRGSNFSADEKELILSFVTENAALLESKAADPSIFKKKRQLWENLSIKMKCAGYCRTPAKLREIYFRMKQAAKAKINKFKKEQRKTGGGKGPTDEDGPSEADWAIYNVCPIDFEEDISLFDSDHVESQNICLKPTHMPSIPSPCSPGTSFGLIDPVTGEIETHNEDNKPVLNPGLPFTSQTPTAPKNVDSSIKSRKRKREMTLYEEEMLKLQKKHIEARIENEKLINKKEQEILEIKKEAEKIRLYLLKNLLETKSSSEVNLGNI